MRVEQQARQMVGGWRQRVEESTAQRRMRRRLRAWVALAPSPQPLQISTRVRTTVIIPCYNHAQHLPFAIQSLREQTLGDFDSVFVNDYSSDETDELLPGLADSLRHKGTVTIVRHQRNWGQAAALNAGIRLARTPLITILNDDDWLMPHALKTLVEIFRVTPELGLVGAGSLHFSGLGIPVSRHDTNVELIFTQRWDPSRTRTIRRYSDFNMTHSGMTLSRAAWQSVGGYRSDVKQRIVKFSDRDIQLRIGTLYPIALIDQPLVWWRADSSVDAGLNS